MTYAALGLMAANVVGSGATIIIRHMRDVHWATQVTSVTCHDCHTCHDGHVCQALGSRLLIVVLMFAITAAMGDLCLPECGWERGGTVLLGLVATICQATMIKAIQIG